MPSADAPPDASVWDVLVVGAGFTGLAAAAALHTAGRRVLVLEAQPQVGGRVASTVNSLGERVDTGGQFFCEDMPTVTALARAHAKTFVEPNDEGETLLRPPLPPGVSPDSVWRQSNRLRERLNDTDPDSLPARTQTVAQWVEAADASTLAKAAFLATVNGLWCVDPAVLPAWFLIENDRRNTNEVYELQHFLAETMASLAESLAATLPAGALRLNTPVRALRWSEAGVDADTPHAAFHARAGLVAVPPVSARRLAFTPALPDALARALAAWGPCAVLKLTLRYPTPFWRAQGLSGTVAWRDPAGLYAVDAGRENQPALVVFVGGPLAARLHEQGEAQAQRAVLARLAEALGPQAAAPSAVTSRDWTADPWSGGAYADVILDATARDAEDRLRRGHAPLFFRSSELSPSFPGYIEGALVAGRDAAAQLLGFLSHPEG